jgi:hypothetical protein
MNKCNLKTTMKKFTKLLCFLFITQLSFSQTTEDFETETIGGTTFSDNGQNFTITNGPGESTYDVETFAGGGWNGTAPDNRFLDNSGAGAAGAPLNDGTSFTISTSDGADILVNRLYLFLSTRTLQVASSTLTITGRKDGATVYTIVKSTGFSNPVTFTPNNGFTLIDFSTEGGSDNSNTAVDELIFSTTGNGDYAAVDGINWEAIACTAPDIPTATSAPGIICDGNSALLTISGNKNDATAWHVYTGTCGGTPVGSTTGTTIIVTPGLPSTEYFIRGEGGCVTPASCGSVVVTVTPREDASFTYAASAFCADGVDPTPTITGVPGGTFFAGGGLALNTTTGTIDVSASTPATYTVTYNTPGLCDGTEDFIVTINALDDASFTYSASAYCVDDSDPGATVTGLGGGTFSSTAGLSINAGTGQIDVSSSTPGTYTVTYTTTGACPNSSGVSVTVNTLDDASFTYPASTYCANDTDPATTVTGLGGGTFSSTAGLSINAATGLIDLSASTPGTYTVTYTTAGTCPNSSGVSVTVNALDDASFNYGAASYCSNDSDPTPTITGLAGGTFSSTAGLSINAATGLIDLSVSTPGTYTVTYTTAGLCPNSSGVSVTVNALDDASFNYGVASYCSNDSDPTPTITGLAGGTFSSTAGLSINAATGLIDLSASTPGTYTVTYTTAGTCPNSSGVSVTVNALDDASFNYGAASYCSNDSDPTPTITGLAGGTFSSTAGLSINAATGNIDLSVSTPGTYTVTYTTAGTCPNSSGVSVTVNALDDASFNYGAASYCSNDSDPTPTITGLAGGTFTSTAGLSINAATGNIDLSVSTPGTYTVTYTTAGLCPNSSGVSVTVNALDDASFNYGAASYCSNDSDPTPTITGLAGGIFTSTAGLSINAATGNIDLSVSTPGTYTVTYTTAGTCPNSSGVSVTVNALDDASFNYGAASYCSNDSDPTPTITGLAGGTFSSTAGLSINAATGNIDLSVSTPGTYTVTYTTAGLCPNSSGVSVTVNALDDASFNYGAASYCSNDSDPTPTITGLAGGTFTSTAGLSINAAAGNIDLSVSTPGTYTVTYTTSGACPNSSGVSVTVNALDDASFSYSAAGYCLGDSDPTPTITGLGGGTFTVLPLGLNINPTTGFINIGLSTPNSYTVTYTTAGTCPNSSNVAVTIGTPPASPSVVSPMTVCPGADVILSATGSGTGSLIFYNNVPAPIGTVPMPPATGTLNIGSLGIGSYSFGVTESNGTCQSLPTAISVTVGDVIAPTAVCQNINAYLDGAGNALIVAADIDGGSTDNCGGVTLSASQTAFTCANLGPNNVTLTVTDGNANSANCISVVTVIDTISPVTICPGNQIENVDAACNFTLPDYTSLVTATDNCNPAPTVTQSPVTGTVIAGTTTITMTSDDGNGNTSTCTFDVTLNDATAPTAVCQNINVYLDGAGNASIVAADIDGGSTDNCGGVTLSASQTAFTCANLGPNNVTLTVTDGNANSANCISVVTVIDTISPVTICPGNQIENVDAACNFTLPDYTSLVTATDNCNPAPTVTQSPVTGTVIAGTTTITMTSDDGNGNTSTCTFDVTLNDATAPTAVCQNINVYLDGAGNASIVAADIDGGSTDNCGGVTLSASTTAFTCADLGPNNVTLTVTDGNANSSNCISVVTVIDTISPSAVCQDINVYVDGAGNASIVAADIDGGSTDNCGTVNLSASQTAFTCADVASPFGELIITGAFDGPLAGGTPKVVELYVANDIADLSQYGLGSANNGGGTDGIEFTFPAVSATAGQFIYVSTETVEFNNYFGFAPDYTNGGATLINGDDAVELFHLGAVIDVFGDINVDGTGQPWEYLDGWAYRNSSTGPDGTTFQLGNWSFSGINALDGETTNATAATPIPIGTFTPQVIAGPTAVTLTVNDGNGNSDDCIAQVTVLDTISPTITCPANQVEFATASCDFTLIDYTAMATAADNCATVTVSQSPLVGTVISGTTTITLTATDGSGNTSACTFDVSLNDTISPTMVCQNINVYLDGTGNATIVAGDIDGGSTDNCGSVTLAADITAFTCADLGPNTVTLTGTDGNTNTANCTSTVTVLDTISPTASCQDITVFLDGTGNVTFNAADLDNGSTDNCGAVTFTSNFTSFTCAEVGPNTVILTVTDANGNTNTCTSTVTVSDTISPTVSCQDITVFLDGTGNVTFNAADLDNGSTDNCGAVTLASDFTAFTCAEVGPNTVILTVTDANGNTNTCTSTVTVSDTISPTASCQDITVFLDGTGNVTFNAADLNNGSTDNCGAVTFTSNFTSFTCAEVGPNTVILTVTDANGNTNTCTSTVTVSDTISPTASCQDITVFLDATGNVTFNAADLDNGSTDNCGAVTLASDFTAFTCAEVGPNTVILTVTDANGNTNTCTSTVTVSDTISPTASCQDITVFLDATGNVTFNAADLDNGSTDNCGAVTLASDFTAFTCAEVGPNTVTLTVTDASGNTSTCTSTVTVSDTISPTASCQDITVFLDGTGNVTFNAADLDNGSTDNCGAVTLASDFTAFTCAEVGPNTVTLTVTDASGNTSTCTSTVTVSDTISPTASCQDITVFLDATGNVTFNAADLDNGSTDNCTTVTLAADFTSFTCAEVGPNTVVLTVTDASGNTATCTSTVTVSDTISPTASCQDITVFLDGTGNVTFTAADLDNGSTDNCGAVTLASDFTAFTCAEVGPNTVVLTVTDASGNTATCTSTVTVSDTISPTASCQDITVFLDATGNVTFTAADLDNGSTDNCTTVTLASDFTAFTCAEVGPNTVVLTVTDASGNTATCTSTVTVSDTISPTASCQDITVFLDATGNVTFNAADLDNGSTDNCTTVTLASDFTAFTCAEVGPNTVVLTVTDASGNTATCTSTVTVSDTISPTASCQDITVFLDATGNVTFNAADLDNGSTDNCGAVTLASDFTAFTCAEVGPNTVTLTVTDASGNTSTCASTVTVSDTISPTASCQDITVFLDGTGNVTFNAADLDNGSTDNCTTVTLASDFTAFTCAEVGPNTVTLTVTDASGNTSTCTSTVTVSDTISPTASCQDITVFLDGTGNVTFNAADLDNGSTDNCTTVTLASDFTAFTCAEVGPNTVVLTVTDASGNTATCTSTVTVSDTISPTITCPGDVVVNNDPGVCSATGVVLGTPTTADNCSVASTTDNGLVTYPVGVTNVIWTVTDVNGNTSTCTQTVTVIDNEAPVLPIILDVNVECGVTIPVPVATDNCAGSVPGTTTDPLIYTTQGTFVVNWTFDDGNGNVVPFAQNVIVDDVTAPLVVSPLADVTDECSVTLTAPIVNDNCVGAVTGTTITTFPITTQGTTVVTWMYDDGNGNVSSQNQNVIIDDVTLPVADLGTLTDVTAECEVTALTPPTAMDNCSGALVGTSTVILPITAQGTTVVTWMYDDGNGNITLQDQNIIITDVTAPVPDVASLATVTGECSAVVTAPTATDACGGIAIVGTTTDPVSYTTQGTFTVTWTYADANGNSSTQTQTVTVNDVTAPVADVTSLADVTELCSATLTAPMATDNCNGTITGTTSTVFPVTATTVVTWTYDDGNGNVSTQNQNVTITGVDVSTTMVSGVEIMADNASGDSYQWIDCATGAPVGNGTNQNYIATANGSYAVIINQEGCIDTSACVVIAAVGIDDIVKENFNIYPNPIVDGTFTVSFEGEIKNIELQDLQGRIIKVLHSTSTGQVNVGDLARGKYFVRVTTATDQVLVKSIIIIQ